MSETATQLVLRGLNKQLDIIHGYLRNSGAPDLKLTLIARSPTDPQWFIVHGSDELPAVAKLLADNGTKPDKPPRVKLPDKRWCYDSGDQQFEYYDPAEVLVALKAAGVEMEVVEESGGGR